MEEDPTPVPSVGLRKHLITNDEGVITGEETSVDLGHTESGRVPAGVCICAAPKLMFCFPSKVRPEFLLPLLAHFLARLRHYSMCIRVTGRSCFEQIFSSRAYCVRGTKGAESTALSRSLLSEVALCLSLLYLHKTHVTSTWITHKHLSYPPGSLSLFPASNVAHGCWHRQRLVVSPPFNPCFLHLQPAVPNRHACSMHSSRGGAIVYDRAGYSNL